MSIGKHHSASAGTTTWITPPHVIEALGGADGFDLDPCAAVNQPWPCARQSLTISDNGLLQRWSGRVWLNPPYTNAEIGKWMARLGDHGTGTALIFARTETEFFQRQVFERADALLYLEGRLHFHVAEAMTVTIGKRVHDLQAGDRYPANAGAPSVLCAYGTLDTEILASCGLPGSFMALTLAGIISVQLPVGSWIEEVRSYLEGINRPVTLSELYRAFATHRKARDNPNYRAKIRQTLQRGDFNRIEAGLWST
ncbi:MAG: adenine methyltransferase [Nitratireductor sp.]|nr:adenine methyltransferase [Nitratireductor sp.]